MKKISVLLAVAMIASLFAAFAVTASAEESIWDGTYPEVNAEAAFGGGSGTVDDPYLISSAADLAQLCVNSNSEDKIKDYYGGIYFKFTVDIILNENYSEYASWGSTPPANVWTPIAQNLADNNSMSGGIFKGIIYGAGHVIKGMYVKDDSEKWTMAAGFIGMMGGDIYKLGFENCYVEANSTAGVGAGIIAASLGNTNINNVTKCDQCYVKDSYVSAWRGAGLISGITPHTYVTNCYSTGTVNVGREEGEADCSGLCAWCNSASSEVTIENCYTVFKMTGGTGICGNIMGNVTSGVATIDNCYFDSQYSDVENAFGWVCEDSKEYCYAEDLQSAQMTVSKMSFKNSVWSDTEGGTPVLSVFASPEAADADIITGESADPGIPDTDPVTSEPVDSTVPVTDENPGEITEPGTKEAGTTEKNNETGSAPDTDKAGEKDKTFPIWIPIAAAVLVIAVVAGVIITKKRR